MFFIFCYIIFYMSEYTIKDFLEIKRAVSPCFNYNNQLVLYLSNISGTHQIYSFNLNTKETKQLTFFDEPVDFIVPSPVDNKLIYGLSKGGNEKNQFYFLNLDDNSVSTIIEDFNVKHIFGGISRDGKKICYSSNKRDERYFDIFVMDLLSFESKCIYSKDEICQPYGFSPNGNFISFIKANTNVDSELFLFNLNNNEIIKIDKKGKDVLYGRPRWLPNEGGFYFRSNDEYDFMRLNFYNVKDNKIFNISSLNWDIDGVNLSKDGKYLTSLVNENGYIVLSLYETNSMIKLNLNLNLKGIFSGSVWSNDSRYFGFSFENSTKFCNVFIYDIIKNELIQITNLSSVVPVDLFVEPELKRYKSFDNLEVPFFFYLPKNSNKKKYPVIVYMHGGPESQFLPSFSSIFQYFLYKGYAVVAPNIRGSAGYGKIYLALDDREKRFDAIKDLEYLNYALKKFEVIDRDKMFLFGGSYGGYMVLAGLTFQPDLWSGGVDIVGVANFITFLEKTSPYRRPLRESEYGYLETQREMLEKLSPINSIENLKAPLFIIHGSNDPRVPLYEAEQMYSKLKELGRDVALLVYPDEGHGLNKLKNRLDAYPKVVEFLNRIVDKQ